jgi:thioesterase domain-containing protein
VDVSLIEQALCKEPGVKRAVVVVDDASTASQQLVAYLVTDRDIAVAALRRRVAQDVAEWLTPAHFVGVEELPCDRHGKVRRSGLPARSSTRPRLDKPFRAPTSGQEKRAASCFEDVLQIRPVGLDDNFFELGGDSLLAANLAALLEERLERYVPPDCVYDHPTCAEMVSALEDASLGTSAFALQRVDHGTPLFCVHVHADQPSGLHKLAGLLSHRTVYVLRGRRSKVSVEEMARDFIAAMRDVQPFGPYRICGNCFAGVVAFDMAQQLRAAGETVSMLGLIDTAFPPRQPNLTARARVYRRTWRHLITLEQLKARIARLAMRVGVGQRPEPWLDSYQALRIAELRYKPQAYSGPTILFIAGALGNQEGWKHVVTNGLEIVRIADAAWDNEDDRPHLTEEPLVHQLAPALQEALDRTATQGRQHKASSSA